MRNKKVTYLVQCSALIAVLAIVAFTPLGSIPFFGPVVATTAHIPVVIAGISMGLGAGALLGFTFGALSFYIMTFMPPGPTAFLFTPFYQIGDISGNGWSLVICFVPRILTGVVTALVFIWLGKALGEKRDLIRYSVAGFAGSMTNTILVLGGAYIFFGAQFASVLSIPQSAVAGVLWSTFLVNGLPEAVLGAIAARFIGKPLRKLSLAGSTQT
jgi:uncharacterized membrane protein